MITTLCGQRGRPCELTFTHVRITRLAERRLDGLPRVTSAPEAQREQLAGELEVALSRLRSVHTSYWDYDWRRANRGGGRYPEHELWEAVQGYLDLLDADKEV
jgi:hypothetical protein